MEGSLTPARPQLRPYQTRCMADLRAAFKRHRRVAFQLATGGGKSVILAEVMDGAARRGTRVLALVHRDHLLAQLNQHFINFGHWPHLLAAGAQDNPEAKVTVATVQTAARRKLSPYGLILVDELHHAVCRTWDKVMEQQPQAFVLGVTATPRRLDGKPLDGHFDTLVMGPTTRQLQKVQALAELEVYKSDYANIKNIRLVNDQFPEEQLNEILEDYTRESIEDWQMVTEGKLPTIVFCCSIHHCDYVHEHCKSIGINSAVLHSKLTHHQIRQTIRDYAAGKIRMLISCDLIDEGFDVPETAAVLLLRPTESLIKQFQMIGRAMRPKAGGGPALVLDKAGNIDRLREKGMAGLPTDIVEWTLEARKKKKKGQAEIIQSEEEKTPEYVAEASRLALLHDKFAMCSNVEEALTLIEKPTDLFMMQTVIPRRDGKRFRNEYLVHQCRHLFFKRLPFDEGMDRAALALGMLERLQYARVRGFAWARSREVA